MRRSARKQNAARQHTWHSVLVYISSNRLRRSATPSPAESATTANGEASASRVLCVRECNSERKKASTKIKMCDASTHLRHARAKQRRLAGQRRSSSGVDFDSGISVTNVRLRDASDDRSVRKRDRENKRKSEQEQPNTTLSVAHRPRAPPRTPRARPTRVVRAPRTPPAPAENCTRAAAAVAVVSSLTPNDVDRGWPNGGDCCSRCCCRCCCCCCC